MVDHEIGGLNRIYPRGVAAQPLDRVAHRGKIRHHRHAGEVLQQHARWHEGELALARLRLPVSDRLDLVGGDHHAVFAAQHVLEHHLDRIRQARERKAAFLQRRQAEDRVLAAADVERGTRTETVLTHGSGRILSGESRVRSRKRRERGLCVRVNIAWRLDLRQGAARACQQSGFPLGQFA
jgi:hypothetical protein